MFFDCFLCLDRTSQILLLLVALTKIMGIWKNLLSENKDDSDDDLDMNSRRIETNEDKMEELRGMRDDIPQSDYESHEEIDSKIEESHDRLDYLRERRDELHEDNYCDDDSEDEY